MCVLDALMSQEDLSVTDLRDERLWSEFGFVTTETHSGIVVNPDKAMALGAYYDGIRIISEDVAKLPFVTYRRLEPRGKERDREHPVYRLLDEAPNPNMSAVAFRETLTAHAIGWGGGFALIRRNGLGEPTELRPVHPSRVRVEMSRSGRVFYMVGQENNEPLVVRRGNMLHIHGLSPDGVNGYSVARLGAESIGRGLSAAAFSASFFRQGSSPKGTILTNRTFESDEALERLRTQWQNTYAGPNGWNRPVILEAGFEWKPVSIPPEDAQLIETEHFTVLDISRWLRISPHKLGALERATHSNVEEMNIDHVNDTLTPWLRRWEIEAKLKLFRDDPDHFAEHLVTALLRGNSEQRSKFYRELFNIGAMSQNDVRELENLNPIGPTGDIYYINAAMVPSEQAATGAVPAEQRPAGRMDGNDNQPRAIAGAHLLLTATLKRLQQKERKAVSRLGEKHSGDALRREIGTFYARHAAGMEESFGTVQAAIGEMLGAGSARGVEAVNRYVEILARSADAAIALREMDRAGSRLVEELLEEVKTNGASGGL